MTTWTHRTIIVPDAVVAPARLACEALAGAGGSGMYSVPLSPTGELPATHWASSGPIEQEFADMLANPAAECARVAAFLGPRFDPRPAAAAVDPAQRRFA